MVAAKGCGPDTPDLPAHRMFSTARVRMGMEKGRRSGLWLVGAGGLEPPTPTVSKMRNVIFNTYARLGEHVRKVANDLKI